MVKCPLDFTYCPDDICNGGRCVRTGECPHEFCDVCKTWYQSDYEDCECDYDDDDSFGDFCWDEVGGDEDE